MMDIEILKVIASNYRQKNKIYRPHVENMGYVFIFEEEAYGWRAELIDPETERPGVYAVSVTGNIYQAKGGDYRNGAKEWTELE